MNKEIFKKIIVTILCMFVSVYAQDKVDAIEAARQAKAAAEKAASDAEAATAAAIEQAAEKAAKDARDKIKREKEEELARKLAEKKAAEDAELDAAANAAAEEAKRRMAEELGLEYSEVDPNTSNGSSDDSLVETESQLSDETDSEAIDIKESSGFNFGISGSYGFLQGNFFESIPAGVSFVVSTPYGFNVGGLRLGLSGTLGAYPAEHNDDGSLTPIVAGVGANLTIASLVFTEGHLGLVGDAFGGRGFAGISLEKIMNKSLNLPFNVLIGSEVFFSTLMKEGIGDVNEDGTGGSPTWWGGLGIRLDYNL